MRFFRSLLNGILWGIFGAICISGLYTFFWMLMPPVRLGREDPFANLPLFDAILLIATPVVSSLTMGAMGFWMEWAKGRRRFSRLPVSCPR